VGFRFILTLLAISGMGLANAWAQPLRIQVVHQSVPPAHTALCVRVIRPELFSNWQAVLNQSPKKVVSSQWVATLVSEYLKHSKSQSVSTLSELDNLEAILRQAIEQQQLTGSELYSEIIKQPIEDLIETPGQRLFVFLIPFAQSDSIQLIFHSLQKMMTGSSMEKNSPHFWSLRYLLIEVLGHRIEWPENIAQFLHDTSVMQQMNESIFDIAFSDSLLMLNFTSEVLENYLRGYDMARRITAFTASDLARSWAMKQKKTTPTLALARLFDLLATALKFRVEKGAKSFVSDPLPGQNGWFFFTGHERDSTLAIDPEGRIWRGKDFSETWLTASSEVLKDDKRLKRLDIIPIRTVFSPFPNSPDQHPAATRDMRTIPYLQTPVAYR